jgi:hypothetical protein
MLYIFIYVYLAHTRLVKFIINIFISLGDYILSPIMSPTMSPIGRLSPYAFVYTQFALNSRLSSHSSRKIEEKFSKLLN